MQAGVVQHPCLRMPGCCRLQLGGGPATAPGEGSSTPDRSPGHEDRSPSELPCGPTGRAGYHRTPRVEVAAKAGHCRIEDKAAFTRQSAEHRSMWHRAGRVVAAPQRPAHAASAGQGKICPLSGVGTPPVGGSGPRQRGHKRHHRRKPANRSTTNNAPQRRQRIARLIVSDLLRGLSPSCEGHQHKWDSSSGGREAT